MANAVLGSFNIYEGQRLPLAGAKRKDIDSTDHSSPSKVVKLVDFNQVMKSRCAEYLAKRQKDWVVTSLVEENWFDQLLLSKKEVIELLVAFKRLRKALRENDNFLQYYSDRKVKNKVHILRLISELKGCFPEPKGSIRGFGLGGDIISIHAGLSNCGPQIWT